MHAIFLMHSINLMFFMSAWALLVGHRAISVNLVLQLMVRMEKFTLLIVRHECGVTLQS